MKDVLIMIKDEFLSRPRYGNSGLCSAAANLFKMEMITKSQWKEFKTIIRAQALSQEVFYTHLGEETIKNDKFLWPITDKASRLAWIDNLILTSK